MIDVDPWGGSLAEAVEERGGTSSRTDEPVVLPDGTPAHLQRADEHRPSRLFVVNGNRLVTVIFVGNLTSDWERNLGRYDATMRSLTTPVDAPAPTGAERSGHAAQPGLPFRHDDDSFSIVPPAGWTIIASEPEEKPESVHFQEPDRPGTGPRSSASISLVTGDAPDDSDEPGITLAGQVEDERLLYEQRYNRDEPVVLADGTPAHRFEGTFDGTADGSPVLVLLVVANGETYRLEAATRSAATWERNREAIEASVRSFTVS